MTLINLFKISFYSLLFALLVISCRPEEVQVNCLESKDLGEYFLENDMFLPYSLDDEVVIFSDSLGKEYRAEIIHHSHEESSTQSGYWIDCDFLTRPELEPEWIYYTERKYLLMHIIELDIKLIFFYDVNLEHRDDIVMRYHNVELENIYIKDVLDVRLYKPIITDVYSSVLRYVVAERDFPKLPPRDSIIRSDVLLHGRQYENVFYLAAPDSLQEFIMYYSEDNGLVGIEEIDGSISLKYERTE